MKRGDLRLVIGRLKVSIRICLETLELASGHLFMPPSCWDWALNPSSLVCLPATCRVLLWKQLLGSRTTSLLVPAWSSTMMLHQQHLGRASKYLVRWWAVYSLIVVQLPGWKQGLGQNNCHGVFINHKLLILVVCLWFPILLCQYACCISQIDFLPVLSLHGFAFAISIAGTTSYGFWHEGIPILDGFNAFVDRFSLSLEHKMTWYYLQHLPSNPKSPMF